MGLLLFYGMKFHSVWKCFCRTNYQWILREVPLCNFELILHTYSQKLWANPFFYVPCLFRTWTTMVLYSFLSFVILSNHCLLTIIRSLRSAIHLNKCIRCLLAVALCLACLNYALWVLNYPNSFSSLCLRSFNCLWLVLFVPICLKTSFFLTFSVYGILSPLLWIHITVNSSPLHPWRNCTEFITT